MENWCNIHNLVYSDNSGSITYDEFKNVLSASIGPDAIPFDFEWYIIYNWSFL